MIIFVQRQIFNRQKNRVSTRKARKISCLFFLSTMYKFLWQEKKWRYYAKGRRNED